MLDLKFIREHADLVKEGAKNKRFEVDIDHLLDLDQKRKPLQLELESLQAERNQISKSIGKAAPEDRNGLKAKVTDIKKRMEQIESTYQEVSQQIDDLMMLVPAPPRADVPVGKDDTENTELRQWGTTPKFDFPVKDHVELGTPLGLDVERGVKLAGSRSYVLKGKMAQLETAILRLTVDLLIGKGYTPVTVPVLVKEHCMEGTGYFPLGRDQAYLAERDNMALVGTSEVSLTSLYRDEIIAEDKLPIRMFSQSSCFRREAGTYGKDTHGLYRVHQFQKVEQVILGVAEASDSEELHMELLGNAEEIMHALELPYRIVYVCTGDLGQGQIRKHDIEAWMPSREAYSETHSCSTFHDFQARRLKLRYKQKVDGGGKPKNTYCYTLNNTAVASPRILIPLLEVHQQEDGSIRVPVALRNYLGGEEVLRDEPTRRS